MKHITNLASTLELPLSERQQWYIPEAISTAHPIHESGDALVDIGEAASRAKVPIIISLVYSRQVSGAFLRERAAEHLIAAIQSLQLESEQKLTLKITDAYRPLAIQRKRFNHIEKEISTREGLQGKALWERVTQFIADPNLCPPHSTGGAIDCTLFSLEDDKELPMGTPINTTDNRAHTWNPGITYEERLHRELLFFTMTHAGFINLASEWWHFSYGDQYWAVMRKEPYALYGTLKDP